MIEITENTINNPNEEIRIDAVIESPNINPYGTVYGIITDITNNPIQNGTVKIMGEDYTPVTHGISDVNGNYIIQNIPANNTYTIFAILNGYKLNQGTSFNISSNERIERNFILKIDESMKLAIIAGDVIDSISNGTIYGAKVSLFKIDKNDPSIETLIGATFTNYYGQFTFREIPTGNYIIFINHLGYKTIKYTLSIVNPKEIFPMTFSIVKSQTSSVGTVSGVIRNFQGEPIGNADVILYRVNQNNSLTPIAFTRTADDGVYLFANVPIGIYKIKSTETKKIQY